MTLFYLKFILTNILFSLIIGAVLLRYNRTNDPSGRPTVWEFMLYALGLGPALTVLLLYYLMLLLPAHGNAFYVVPVFLLYAILAVVGRKGFPILWTHITAFFSTTHTTWKAASLGQKIKDRLYVLVILCLLVAYAMGYFGTVAHNRLEGHDALIYGNFGKMYHQEKKISYAEVMRPATNGFLFQGSPKPSFSLLLTWELMLNHTVLNKNQAEAFNKTADFDAYYRSISGYYAFLIIALTGLWLYRKNRYLPFVGIVVLASGLNFFLMSADLHLDSIRIYFLLLSWIWLAYAIDRKDRFSLFLLAMFSGFSAFFHLIGLATALINGLAFLLFATDPWKKRAVQTGMFFLVMVLFGGIHYVLEGMYGAESGFLSYFSRFLGFVKN